MTIKSLKNVAVISVDNTKTFENQSYNELYVKEGEQAAIGTKQVLDFCRTYGALLVNVFDKHPKGHISFASSYRDKKPFDFISLEEVNSWDNNDGLSDKAAFTIDQLKNYLLKSPNYTNQVWPDHGKDWTDSINLMEPLNKDMFDIHIVKGDKVDTHPYGGFVGTGLNEELKKKNIKKVIVTGVATDYCSGQTALEAVERDYETFVIKDAVRGVAPESTQAMIEIFNQKKIRFITLEELKNILFL